MLTKKTKFLFKIGKINNSHTVTRIGTKSSTSFKNRIEKNFYSSEKKQFYNDSRQTHTNIMLI
ncbi:MAG: hypothetical protein D6680_13985 [Cyanobacteria bacterium J007]|nr:MAG: hypothetical protein D6680_13985 [Cyanobacteria bacterium J007]